MSVSSGAELPAATLDALVARADGVPLYVEELTKAVTEFGAAQGVEAIPATLADSLMGRLDRLAKLIGAGHVLNGSDYPHPEGLAWPLEFVDELDGLSEADIPLIMRDNLARLVGQPL